MPFKKIKIIAKEQNSGKSNIINKIYIVYVAKRIGDARNMKDYENSKVVKINFVDQVSFEPQKLSKYCKDTSPVWIRDEFDPVEELEEKINILPNTEKDNIEHLLRESPIATTEMQEDFLRLAMFEGMKYDDIEIELGINRETFSKWWDELNEERLNIRRALNLFNSRIKSKDFKPFFDTGKYAFYQWFKKQPRKCYYCEVEEYKLRRLFDKDTGILETKRYRGPALELERKDSMSNQYSTENCVLACYFCNNHKSDLITELEHKQFFSKQIKEYIDHKYNQLEVDYDF